MLRRFEPSTRHHLLRSVEVARDLRKQARAVARILSGAGHAGLSPAGAASALPVMDAGRRRVASVQSGEMRSPSKERACGCSTTEVWPAKKGFGQIRKMARVSIRLRRRDAGTRPPPCCQVSVASVPAIRGLCKAMAPATRLSAVAVGAAPTRVIVGVGRRHRLMFWVIGHVVDRGIQDLRNRVGHLGACGITITFARRIGHALILP